MAAAAETRTARMPPVFAEPHPQERSLAALRRQANACERCDLYKHATHTVFGEGPSKARVIFVGEQPGDNEDIAGKPFIGPAGRLLDKCLEEAGVDRSLCYVTNAVKHFKFEQRGRRRLHAKPNAGEIQRCAWWLGGELDLLGPDLIVALGATALYALMGRSVGLTKERGHVLQAANGMHVLVTIHPSYLLRIRDHDDRESERRRFIGDLESIRHHLDRHMMVAGRNA
ncbi:UdgX family uracil-DNA binding protein [Rhizobium sp. B230/85]|uniref:UdgX family uracil-DNA binding protein n=1 Tax=unclassified Rhizobium TaxID=2613769 RepID=UPI001ADC7CAF|nr:MULTISPECIES: UdgX family uracil-DNA binding protein [unclassified Rhizobium]MBO9136545.1 UdgX family uracil-DNA binding protein [Rhizobium sp. B209b/85]QXZ98541.1 UdgX family uracil-DNA binding protein [Rhizobium sp. B230/85]